MHTLDSRRDLPNSRLTEETIVIPLLQKLGVDTDAFKRDIGSDLSKKSSVSGSEIREYFSAELESVFDAAQKEADNFKDQFISTEHLFLGLFSDRSGIEHLFKRYNVQKNAVLSALKEIRGVHTVTDQNPEGKYQSLEKYGKDLTQLAKQGKLDPVIGRDAEIRRAIQVLSRRTKNNPVLIGDPGTGKTAIVEGLARRIAGGDVPTTLKNKRLVALDIGGMVAGAKYPQAQSGPGFYYRQPFRAHPA
jgi:ATP-dependent Clp protease ATP-binding subunit ClpB